MKEIRSNKFFLVSYCDVEFIQSVLDRKISQIQGFAFIKHDKDVYLNDVFDKETNELKHAKGELEIEHVHIYLELFNSRLPSEVVAWFECYDDDGRKINTLREFPYSCQSCIDYLTHKNAKDKYQYNVDDVVSYGLKRNDDGSLAPNLTYDNSYDVLDQLIAGVALRELVKRYGREFIYHYKAYRALADDIIAMELKEQYKSNDELEKSNGEDAEYEYKEG